MKSAIIALALGLSITAPVAAQPSDEALAPVYNALEDPCDFMVFAETYPDSAFAPLALRRGEACGEAGEDAGGAPAPWRRYDDTDWNTADEEAALHAVFEETDLAALVDAAEAGDTTAALLAARAQWLGVGIWRNRPAAIELYADACEAGQMRSCVWYGLAYSAGGTVDVDLDLSERMWRRACDAGEMFGCAYLGFLYATGGGGVEENDARGADLYRRACEAGVSDGCGQLGFMYTRGYGVERDEARGLGLLREACERGYIVACNNLANAYFSGAGVAEDRDEAKALWAHSCDHGNVVGCEMSARFALGRYGGPSDRAAAFEFMERGCARNDEQACERLHEERRWVWDRGVPISQSRWYGVDPETVRRACEDGSGGHAACAMQVWQSGADWPPMGVSTVQFACEAGDPTGCSLLVYAYRNGLDGVDITHARAVEVAVRACGGGDAWACVHAVELKWDVDMAFKELDAVRALAHRACLTGMNRGCALYAGTYAVILPDAPHAETELANLLTEYCDADADRRPCWFLAQVFDTPRGVAPDAEKARRYAAGGCEAGVEAACAWLEDQG